MKNTKNLERKSSADRITCFLPLYYNPLVGSKFKVEDGVNTPYYSKEGHNILITGQCGTGKTFALKYDFYHHMTYNMD